MHMCSIMHVKLAKPEPCFWLCRCADGAARLVPRRPAQGPRLLQALLVDLVSWPCMVLVPGPGPGARPCARQPQCCRVLAVQGRRQLVRAPHACAPMPLRSPAPSDELAPQRRCARAAACLLRTHRGRELPPSAPSAQSEANEAVHAPRVTLVLCTYCAWPLNYPPRLTPQCVPVLCCGLCRRRFWRCDDARRVCWPATFLGDA